MYKTIYADIDREYDRIIDKTIKKMQIANREDKCPYTGSFCEMYKEGCESNMGEICAVLLYNQLEDSDF